MLYYILSIIYPMILQIKNTTMSIHTTVAPTGVDARMDNKMPDEEQSTEIAAEARITARKLLNIRMADSAGKMIRAEIRSDPTSFMAITMTEAVTTAINRLYRLVFIPVA
jgi:hypothetical protein